MALSKQILEAQAQIGTHTNQEWARIPRVGECSCGFCFYNGLRTSTYNTLVVICTCTPYSSRERLTRVLGLWQAGIFRLLVCPVDALEKWFFTVCRKTMAE